MGLITEAHDWLRDLNTMYGLNKMLTTLRAAVNHTPRTVTFPEFELHLVNRFVYRLFRSTWTMAPPDDCQLPERFALRYETSFRFLLQTSEELSVRVMTAPVNRKRRSVQSSFLPAPTVSKLSSPNCALAQEEILCLLPVSGALFFLLSQLSLCARCGALTRLNVSPLFFQWEFEWFFLWLDFPGRRSPSLVWFTSLLRGVCLRLWLSLPACV